MRLDVIAHQDVRPYDQRVGTITLETKSGEAKHYFSVN
jgi:hypothetical protein